MGIKVCQLDCLSWKDLVKIANDNNLLLEKWDISKGQSSPREYRYVLCSHLDDKIVARETDSPKEKEKAQERVRVIINRIKTAGGQIDELVSRITSEYTIAI